MYECEKIKLGVNNKTIKYDPVFEGHFNLLAQETQLLGKLT